MQKDGGNLSDETVRKLKTAAKIIKGKGLALDVKPETEKFLLEPQPQPGELPKAN